MQESHVDHIYDRLPLLVVDLDKDPVGRGPSYIQEQVAVIRGYLNEVGVYFQEVLRHKGRLESQLRALQSAFEISSDSLMASDERVTRLPSIQDRAAMVRVILSEEHRAISDKNSEVLDIGYLEKAVRHRHRELEQTMSALRLQRSLIQTDIRTGSVYGDEGASSRGDTWQGDDYSGLSLNADDDVSVCGGDGLDLDLDLDLDEGSGSSKDTSMKVLEDSEPKKESSDITEFLEDSEPKKESSDITEFLEDSEPKKEPKKKSGKKTSSVQLEDVVSVSDFDFLDILDDV